MGKEAGQIHDIEGARILALLGDSVTTDHISPAGAIPEDMARYIDHTILKPDATRDEVRKAAVAAGATEKAAALEAEG